MKRIIAVLLLVAVSTLAYSKDKGHSMEYQVGIFSSTGEVSDGSFTNCSGGGCSGYSASHNVHFLTTNQGRYSIEAPISMAGSIFLSLATDGHAPTVHKEWFMDQLHEGDKVLFVPKCYKHNHCVFWLPNPDKVGKEILTQGYLEPFVAKTNTKALCGKGKLSAAVETQVCD